MVLVFAESAYLFRHALLRDAAYQLQLPGYRAHLHGLALRILEAHFGGRRPSTTEAHPSDPFAEDLAAHAALAAGAPGADAEEFTALQRLYLRGAAGHADR